jgi:hypothetical protein
MFRKTIITGIAAIGMLAVGGTALADEPDGTYDIAPVANDNASQVGKQSSQIHQNGQFVSGRYVNLEGWQNQRADRSDAVQAALAVDGLGSQG